MGGRGSGRWHYSQAKSTADFELRIGIKSLKKAGVLLCGNAGSFNWPRHRNIPSIRFKTFNDHIVLKYWYQRLESDGQEIKQTIKLEQQPCHLGGYRTWFRCPHCNRRTSALFFVGRLFRCRICHGLTYTSQQSNKIDRLINKINRIHNKLGVRHLNALSPLPNRPLRMHRKTYHELKESIEDAKDQLCDAIIARFGFRN